MENYKRIVVKVGSAVLTDANGIVEKRLENLVLLLAKLNQKYEVILVSSGAVASGYSELQLDKSSIVNKQSLAAIGQPLLMKRYKRAFAKHQIVVAQILVTSANFDNTNQTTHIKEMVDNLLKHKVIPIVNENDSTVIDELIIGDNDQLSSYVAINLNADLLVILSDIDGYYNLNPHENPDAKLQSVVNTIDKAQLEKQPDPNNKFATGGIVTKLKAAQNMLQNNKPMFLTSGFDLSIIEGYLMNNLHQKGTLFING